MAELSDFWLVYNLDFPPVASGHLAAEANNNKAALRRVFAERALDRKTLMLLLFITPATASGYCQTTRACRSRFIPTLFAMFC